MGRINLSCKSSRGSLQVQAQPVLHSEFQDSIKSTIERKKREGSGLERLSKPVLSSHFTKAVSLLFHCY